MNTLLKHGTPVTLHRPDGPIAEGVVLYMSPSTFRDTCPAVHVLVAHGGRTGVVTAPLTSFGPTGSVPLVYDGRVPAFLFAAEPDDDDVVDVDDPWLAVHAEALYFTTPRPGVLARVLTLLRGSP